MKRFFRFLFFSLLMLFLAILLFFFWAKSPRIVSEKYNQELQNNVPISVCNDSLLTVMTYNIGYLSGMTNNLSVRPSREFYQQNEKRIVQMLSETHPDLVGFQEIDYDSKRSYEVNQHEMIAKKMYPYSVRAVNWDKRYVPFPYFPPSVHFGKILSGQSIMSKFPVANSERIVLEEVASQPFYYKALYLKRLLQITTIKHPLGNVALMNVHTEAFDQKTRKKQVDFIYKSFWELAEEMPVILVGDFNSDPEYAQSAISKFLNDNRIGKTGVLAKSYPSDNPIERLDYIFFTAKDFELVNARIVSEFGTISDHLPCIATLRLRKSVIREVENNMGIDK